MPINPGRSWCDAQDHHGAETSFAAARPRHPAGGGRARGREQDSSGGFHREPGEGMHYPETVSLENRPRGGGADGEGDGTSPAPCLMRLPLNGFRWNTPTARPPMATV
ncbi:MAG: hypothetical protein PWQ69_1184 [Methanomicrobiaceae archaeon]|nr:hypothetical protein [Methanomicrobiaceae archaeon]